jgi:hypothetical protein
VGGAVRTVPLVQVIHYGRNSLPVLRIFENRFCRPPEGEDELWGYNEHALRWTPGPEYFIARDRGQGEVLIDYRACAPHSPRTALRAIGRRDPTFARCGTAPSSATSSEKGTVIRFEYKEPFASLLGSHKTQIVVLIDRCANRPDLAVGAGSITL